MYRRILLAYDGSVEGRTALREGALLARRYKAQVFLLSVLVGSAEMNAAESLQSGTGLEGQTKAFEAILEEGADRLRAVGMEPATKLVSGEPAMEISKYARAIGADLVVVSHRKQSLLSRWWSGSSGAYLIDNIECSLLIARNLVTDEEVREEIDMIQAEKPLD